MTDERTLRTSEEAMQRMEALARYIAEHCHPDGGLKMPATDSRHTKHVANEAYAIVAMLPEPVDPDIQLSREIAAATCADDGANPEFCEYIRAGRLDTQREVKVALAALRRGRKLAASDA